MTRLSSRSALFALVVAAVAAPASQGQQPTVISGRVIDQDGSPVAGQQVLLHRVAGQDGARIGETVSAEDGSFRFTLEDPPSGDAVYFATARYEGQVYVGAFLEPPIDAGSAYDLVVGGEPVSFDAPIMPPSSGVETAAGPPPSSRRWALAIIPLLAVLGVGAASILSRRGQRDRRHLLVRLAVIEEEMAVQGDTEGLRRERARIIEQLGGRSAT